MREIKRIVPLLLILLVLRADVSSAASAEIDRLLAAANGKVLTELDLELARRLNSLLLFGKNPTAAPTRNEEISRLIDLELVRQELQSFPMDPDDESKIAGRMEELRKAYEAVPGGLAAVAWQCDLSESDIRSYLRLQGSIMRFVNFRFRPFVTVSETEAENYYMEKLLPRLRDSKAPIPPLPEVSSKIEEILREEKVNSALDQWIQDLRRHSRIEYFLGGDTPSYNK